MPSSEFDLSGYDPWTPPDVYAEAPQVPVDGERVAGRDHERRRAACAFVLWERGWTVFLVGRDPRVAADIVAERVGMRIALVCPPASGGVERDLVVDMSRSMDACRAYGAAVVADAFAFAGDTRVVADELGVLQRTRALDRGARGPGQLVSWANAVREAESTVGGDAAAWAWAAAYLAAGGERLGDPPPAGLAVAAAPGRRAKVAWPSLSSTPVVAMLTAAAWLTAIALWVSRSPAPPSAPTAAVSQDSTVPVVAAPPPGTPRPLDATPVDAAPPQDAQAVDAAPPPDVAPSPPDTAPPLPDVAPPPPGDPPKATNFSRRGEKLRSRVCWMREGPGTAYARVRASGKGELCEVLGTREGRWHVDCRGRRGWLGPPCLTPGD